MGAKSAGKVCVMNVQELAFCAMTIFPNFQVSIVILTLSYVLAFATFVRTIEVKGAADGLKLYLAPEWTKMKDLKVFIFNHNFHLLI